MENMIEFFDDKGQKLLVSHDTYRDEVLPRMLEEAWNKSEQLASIIMKALSDGFYSEVAKAAKHLLLIDNTPERAISLYGIVLINMEQYAEAEKTFLKYLNHHPKNPYVLTNLAKAKDFLNKKTEALEILEESLSMDPNQDNGFQWWFQIKIEEFESQSLSHEDAISRALQEANERFGGWRCKLFLGEQAAEASDKETARQYFENVLKEDWTPDALTHISGVLGKNGLIEEMIELIAPIYDPQQHEILTGINLLQAYLESNQISEGQILLKKLVDLNNFSFEEQLSWYEAEFLKVLDSQYAVSEDPRHVVLEDNQPLISEDLQDAMVEKSKDAMVEESTIVEEPTFIEEPTFVEEPINIASISLDFPLWCHGWNIKHRFESAQTGKKIAFFQFAWAPDPHTMTRNVDVENTEGMLARAIPLFLLEYMYYATDASASFIFPLHGDTGAYILFESLPPTQEILDLSEQGYDGVVTGTITSNELKLTYWDLSTENPIHQNFKFDLNDLSNSMPQMENFIVEAADLTLDSSDKNKRNFQRIPVDILHAYCMRLAQHLTIYRASQFPDVAKTMLREKNIIQELLQFAVETPSVLQTQLNMLSVIHQCMRYNSKVILNYKQDILEWLDILSDGTSALRDMAKKTAHVFARYCDQFPG